MVQGPEKTFLRSENLVSFLTRWRKQVLGITCSALVVSGLVSLFITPKYKSTVILFPATTNSISRALISEKGESPTQDILKFGEEIEAEQMIQVLKSDEIRDKITKKYDLLKHYDIDADDPYKMTKLYEEFEDNISFDRTEYLSVKISVLDKDPKLAANIANDIAALLDSAQDRIEKERAREAFKIVEKEYKSVKEEIMEIHDSLKSLRGLGINDYETQSSVFNEQYAKALASANKQAIQVIENKLKVLSDFGGAYVQLREKEELRIKRFNLLKEKLEEAKIDVEQKLPHKFIVNNAFIAEKKTYPVRWLIILTSTLAAFLLSVILIMGFENYLHVKKD